MENLRENPAKLNRNLCKGEAFINDKKYKYFLITNGVCKESCCNMKDISDLDWVSSIEWQVVFDFDNESFKHGLGRMIFDSKDVLIKPSRINGKTKCILL